MSKGSGQPGLAWILAKVLAQVVIFWPTFLAVIPWLLVRIERATVLRQLSFPGSPASGAALLLSGGILGLWSAAVMAVAGRGTPLPLDPPHALVIAGPYRWVRNPMAIGGLVQGAGAGLWLGSPLVIAYVIAGGLIWHFVVRRWEEADLARRFGEAYTAYRDSVPLWILRRPRGSVAGKRSAALPPK